MELVREGEQDSSCIVPLAGNGSIIAHAEQADVPAPRAWPVAFVRDWGELGNCLWVPGDC